MKQVIRVIYCFDDGTFAQVEGEALDTYKENITQMALRWAKDGHDIKPVKWQEVDLNYDR